MRKVNLFLVAVVSSFLLISSCAPSYRCGAISDKKIIGKNLKNLVVERNELCTNLAQKENENAQLKEDLNSLQKDHEKANEDYKSLNEKHKNLIDQNISQTDRFNKSLTEKSDELTRKEKLCKNSRNWIYFTTQ